MDPGLIRELATCRWIAHGDTLVLLGPPGTEFDLGQIVHFDPRESCHRPIGLELAAGYLLAPGIEL